MSECVSQHFGKYRGKVENNTDPKKLGRLQISVPAVLGDGRSSWAMPCVPYAGKKVGFFMIPPEGANIWVEFEGGDPDYPIWSGCFWGDGEAPQPAEAANKIIQTDAGTLTLSDSPKSKGITLETKAGLKLVMDSQGIEIFSSKNSTIKLDGQVIEINNGEKSIIKLDGQKVTINKDGLEVT